MNWEIQTARMNVQNNFVQCLELRQHLRFKLGNPNYTDEFPHQFCTQTFTNNIYRTEMNLIKLWIWNNIKPENETSKMHWRQITFVGSIQAPNCVNDSADQFGFKNAEHLFWCHYMFLATFQTAFWTVARSGTDEVT